MFIFVLFKILDFRLPAPQNMLKLNVDKFPVTTSPNGSAPHSTSFWQPIWNMLILESLGWIPRKPGILLRRWGYASCLGYLGNGVNINPGVEFSGMDRIEIGHGATIGRQTQLEVVHEGSRIQLGDRTFLHPNVRIQDGGCRGVVELAELVTLDRGTDITACQDGTIKIGRASYIGPYTCISGPGRVAIGAECLIAAQVGIFANNHIFAAGDRSIMTQGTTQQGITIEDDCWLGTGVKVLDGVTIGRGSIIGAGAIVTRSIPPYSVAVGVPAKVIGQRVRAAA